MEKINSVNVKSILDGLNSIDDDNEYVDCMKSIIFLQFIKNISDGEYSSIEEITEISKKIATIEADDIEFNKTMLNDYL